MSESRPDPTAPTELHAQATRRSRRGRALDVPPRPTAELNRALGYVEADVEDLQHEIYGEGEYRGMRSELHAIRSDVGEIKRAAARNGSLAVLALFAIAAAMIWMCVHQVST